MLDEIVNDEDHDDGRQAIAITHMAYGHVS